MSGRVTDLDVDVVQQPPERGRLSDVDIDVLQQLQQLGRLLDIDVDVVTPEEALDDADGRVVESLADMVRVADIAVAHNLKGFDLPTLNTRVLDRRLPPIPPMNLIDTLQLVRKEFNLTYNSLDYLARFLGLEPKHKMEMEDWRRSAKGDLKSLRKMDRYCRYDTQLLEDVLTIIRPYLKGLPRMVDAVREMQHACPHCGSADVLVTKDYRTKASNFAMYQCQRCSGFMRLRSAKKGTKLRFHPL